MPLPIEDTIRVHELYARYNHLVDIVGDAQGVADCFVDDCRYSHARFGTVEGKEAIRDFMQQAVDTQEAGYKHLNDNILLTETEDGATSTAYVITIDGRIPDQVRIDRASMYQDILRKTDDGWRFVERRVGFSVVEEFRTPQA